jgi:hypothetical protein
MVIPAFTHLFHYRQDRHRSRFASSTVSWFSRWFSLLIELLMSHWSHTRMHPLPALIPSRNQDDWLELYDETSAHSDAFLSWRHEFQSVSRCYSVSPFRQWRATLNTHILPVHAINLSRPDALISAAKSSRPPPKHRTVRTMITIKP